MSTFDDAEKLVATLRGDLVLRHQAEVLRAGRFLSPEKYDRLLWLAFASAACSGSRICIDELDAERTK